MRWCVIFMFVGCATSDSGGSAEPRQCERLREHLVDLQVADIHVATGIDREAHRRAMTNALGGDFVSSCTSKLTESQIECALGAGDRLAAAACAAR